MLPKSHGALSACAVPMRARWYAPDRNRAAGSSAAVRSRVHRRDRKTARPLMSLAATILFQHAGRQIIAVWLQTTALNFPMALCWQLFFAGPLVRFLFRQGMKCAVKLRKNA